MNMPLLCGFKLRRKKNRKTAVIKDSEVAPTVVSPSKASISHNVQTSTTESASKSLLGETVSSSSTISANPALQQPTTEVALPRPKDDFNLWARAFQFLQARESDLAGDFARHLASLQDDPDPL